jgi:hypothetical protein
VNVNVNVTATAIVIVTGTESGKKRESAIVTGNVLESETESETVNDLGVTGPNPQLTVTITHVKPNEDVKTTLALPPAIETVQKTQGRRLFSQTHPNPRKTLIP